MKKVTLNKVSELRDAGSRSAHVCMIMRVPCLAVISVVALSLALLGASPHKVHADDKALGAGMAVPLAAASAAAAAKMPTKQDPWPNQNGFIGPTFDGPWRFRFALDAWLPLKVPVTIDDGRGSTTKNIGLGFILNHLTFIMPVNLEVRKGSFGIYWHTLGFRVMGDRDIGRRGKIDWNDGGFLMDAGLSYELGRWALGAGPNAPKLTVEPTLGVRIMYQPVEVSFTRLGKDSITDISNYVPVIGVRTVWDLTEHWNLYIQGDYGGFGVDDSRQTWQGRAAIGYRWRGLGLGWNLQNGYRGMRFFELHKNGVVLTEDAHGPTVSLTIEF